MLPFRVLRWPTPDRLAVGIEMTIRDVNLAILLKALLFPATTIRDPIADGVLFVVLFYGAFRCSPPCPLRRCIAEW